MSLSVRTKATEEKHMCPGCKHSFLLTWKNYGARGEKVQYMIPAHYMPPSGARCTGSEKEVGPMITRTCVSAA